LSYRTDNSPTRSVIWHKIDLRRSITLRLALSALELMQYGVPTRLSLDGEPWRQLYGENFFKSERSHLS